MPSEEEGCECPTAPVPSLPGFGGPLQDPEISKISGQRNLTQRLRGGNSAALSSLSREPLLPYARHGATGQMQEPALNMAQGAKAVGVSVPSEGVMMALGPKHCHGLFPPSEGGLTTRLLGSLLRSQVDAGDGAVIGITWWSHTML